MVMIIFIKNRHFCATFVLIWNTNTICFSKMLCFLKCHFRTNSQNVECTCILCAAGPLSRIHVHVCICVYKCAPVPKDTLHAGPGRRVEARRHGNCRGFQDTAGRGAGWPSALRVISLTARSSVRPLYNSTNLAFASLKPASACMLTSSGVGCIADI